MTLIQCTAYLGLVVTAKYLFLKEKETCVSSCRRLPVFLLGWSQALETALKTFFLLIEAFCPTCHVFRDLQLY